MTEQEQVPLVRIVLGRSFARAWTMCERWGSTRLRPWSGAFRLPDGNVASVLGVTEALLAMPLGTPLYLASPREEFNPDDWALIAAMIKDGRLVRVDHGFVERAAQDPEGVERNAGSTQPPQSRYGFGSTNP